jgi:hypothetical protein
VPLLSPRGGASRLGRREGNDEADEGAEGEERCCDEKARVEGYAAASNVEAVV